MADKPSNPESVPESAPESAPSAPVVVPESDKPVPSPMVDGGLLIATAGKSKVAIFLEKKGKGETERVEARLPKFAVTTKDAEIAHKHLSRGAFSTLFQSAKATSQIAAWMRSSGGAFLAVVENSQTRKMLVSDKSASDSRPAASLPVASVEIKE